MKSVCILLILWCLHQQSLPAQALPETTAGTQLQTKYFDPEQDPIGVQTANGGWQLTVHDSVLIRSLRLAVPGVGPVQSIKKQKIRDQEHLVFEARRAEAPDKAFYIAILLKFDPDGRVFAGRQYHTCSGDPCSWCVIRDNGCFCEDKAPADDPGWTGTCKHSTTAKPALAKVTIGQ